MLTCRDGPGLLTKMHACDVSSSLTQSRMFLTFARASHATARSGFDLYFCDAVAPRLLTTSSMIRRASTRRPARDCYRYNLYDGPHGFDEA